MATKKNAAQLPGPNPMPLLRHIPTCTYVPMSIVQDTPFADGYSYEELENRNISVYSHMIHNRNNGDCEREHWLLNNTVSLWNVAVEKWVTITGSDAEKAADMLTTQDLTRCKPGQGKYTPILNNRGGVINDPVLYRLGKEELLFTSSDSDMERIAEGFFDGLEYSGINLDVNVDTPDGAMVQVQGPRAKEVLEELFSGNENTVITDIPYYWLIECERDENGLFALDENGNKIPRKGAAVRRKMTLLDGTVVTVFIARTGFSRLAGFEIGLFGASKHGAMFWKTVHSVVRKYDGDHIGPGHTQRIPGGILSFGNDIPRDGSVSPLSVYIDDTQRNRIVPANKEGWYRGKEAVAELRANGGPSHLLVGLRIMGEPVGWYNDGSMSRNWQVYDREEVHWLPKRARRQDDGTVTRRSGEPYKADDVVTVEFGDPDVQGRMYVLPDTAEKLGDVTSACWSPENQMNIARGYVPVEKSDVGTSLTVMTEWGLRDAVVIPMPYTPENVALNGSSS